MNTFFLRVTMSSGTVRNYAVFGAMPVAEFQERMAERFPGEVVKKIEWLREPNSLPAVAEFLG